MADTTSFSTSWFFIRPEHEDLLNALVQEMHEPDGVDGEWASEGAELYLLGSVEKGFPLVGSGIREGSPSISERAITRVQKKDRRFRAVTFPPMDDAGNVRVESLLAPLLEPDTWVVVESLMNDNHSWSYAVVLKHADGRRKRLDGGDLQTQLRDALGVAPIDAGAVAAARAARPIPPPPESSPTLVPSPTRVPSTATRGRDRVQRRPRGFTPMKRESHTVNGHTFELVHCPPGTFTMGSPEDEAGREDNETQHEVTLTRGFALGVFPVTQALWQAVTGKNPSEYQYDDEAPRRPVELVSWFDAVRFCNALSAKLGLAAAYTIGEGWAPEVTCAFTASGFRLPTESEWEYAARSGGDALVYAGSDDLSEVGWYDDTEYDDEGEEVSPASIDCPQPVGGKAPTRWGLYDLSGNVGEWCWDRSGDYPSEASTDPVGEDASPDRVDRGGSCLDAADCARAAGRHWFNPGHCSELIGLRLARTIA